VVQSHARPGRAGDAAGSPASSRPALDPADSLVVMSPIRCENTDKHGGKLLSVVGPGGYPLRHPGAVRSTSSRGGFSTAAMARGAHSLPLLMAEFTRSMPRDDRSGRRRSGCTVDEVVAACVRYGDLVAAVAHASPIRWIRGARSVASTRRCGLMPAGRSRLCPWSGRRGASRRGLSPCRCLRPRRGALHSDNNARDGVTCLTNWGSPRT
jgi:hypothetical protein